MLKNKILALSLLVIFLIPSLAHSQDKVNPRAISTVIGTVTKVDFVGNTIEVNVTANGSGQLMSFSVPPQAKIVLATHDIGLADIGIGNPVTIQYVNPTPGKYNAVSIVDNRPDHE
jgi:hypothetical protein